MATSLRRSGSKYKQNSLLSPPERSKRKLRKEHRSSDDEMHSADECDNTTGIDASDSSGDDKKKVHLSPSKSPRNYEKALYKAIEEIKKGGSLILTSLHYGIPQKVIHDKLLSRDLPHVSTLLTRAEDEDLFKWILKSIKSNQVIFKQELMERVGKLKRITRISPVFHKSKYGRTWYIHFLSSHPEIYEDEGVLLRCETEKECVKKKRLLDTEDESSDEEETSIKKDCVPSTDDESSDVEETPIKKECIKKDRLSKTDDKLSNEDETPAKKAPESLEAKYNLKKCLIILHDKLKHGDTPLSSEELESNVELWSKESDKIVVQNKKPAKVCIEKEKTPDLLFSNLCKMAFNDRTTLKKHSFDNHKNLLLTCYKCSEQFESQRLLIKHLNESHKLRYNKCNLCDHVFKLNISLNQHYKRRHPDVDPSLTKHEFDKSRENRNEYVPENKVKKHACKFCTSSFTNAKHLKIHVMKHTKHYQCVYCNKSYTSNTYLQKHRNVCTKKEQNIHQICNDITEEYLKQFALD